jgi:hypothetical protein
MAKKIKAAPQPKKLKGMSGGGFVPNEPPVASLVPSQNPAAGRNQRIKSSEFRKRFGL